MIQIKLRDGRVFMASEAKWSIQLDPDDPTDVVGWDDIETIGLAEVSYWVTNGTFGPAQMPIRGLRFAEEKGVSVEVPLPLDTAKEMGKTLQTAELKVVQSMPLPLLLIQKRHMN